MPSKNKKSKRKDNANQKLCNENKSKTDKILTTTSDNTRTTIKGSETLLSCFKSEEQQELKNVLEVKDLSSMPFIIGAVILNKFETLKKLLKQGYNVNETGQNHMTGLMWAIKYKNIEVIDLLLARGADPTVKNDNGDHALLLALENRLWDEQSFISLWSSIKIVTFVDVDYMSKNGFSMLHMAVRREWREFVNMLIAEKANINIANANGVTPLMLASFRNDINLVDVLLTAGADAVKEDNRGCIALCFAMSSAIVKNLEAPHLIADKLLSELGEHSLSLKDYLQRKVEMIVNLPVKSEKAALVMADMLLHNMIFIIRYISNGLTILYELNIFSRLKNASVNHMENPEYLKTILFIMTELTHYCGCQSLDSDDLLTDNNMMTSFVTEGGADVCLDVLKKYGDNYETGIISEALCPLFEACVIDEKCQLWLQNNYKDILPFYENFLKKHTITMCKSDESHVQLIKVKSKRFRELINMFTNDSRNKASQNVNVSVTTSAGVEHFDEAQECNTLNESNLSSNDIQSNSTIIKLRTKSLKGNISKIKNPNLTDRLNLNGKKPLQQTAESVVLLSSKNECESGCHKNSDNSEESQTDNTCNFESSSDDSDSENKLKEKIPIGNDKANKEESPHALKHSMPVFLFPDWKDKILHIPIQSIIENHGSVPLHQTSSLKLYLNKAENWERLSGKDLVIVFKPVVKYLFTLLEKTVLKYKNLWSKENETIFSINLGDTVNKQNATEIRNKVAELETENLEHLQIQFDSLVQFIETAASNNFYECRAAIYNLENLLLNHEIRGKTLLRTDANMETTKMDDLFMQNFEEIEYTCQNNEISEYVTKFLNAQMSSLDNVVVNVDVSPSAKDENIEINNNVNDEEIDIVNYEFRENPDYLYIQETLALPPINQKPVDKEKLEEIQNQTMAHAYHLIPSIMAICDEDDGEENKTFSSTSSFKTELHESLSTSSLLSVFPNHCSLSMRDTLQKSASCNELLQEKIPSRWYSLISTLLTMNNCQLLLNGDVRISCKEKRATLIIASGGNFSSVELGLDGNSRPIAVKQISKESYVCKLVKGMLNPLLELRHKNLLHYFACDYEENELILATPLCEYNMGQYLMLIKQTPLVCLSPIEIVKQLLEGLLFLHDREDPIVHGNLKPSNIFIDFSGTVRIAEFGMYKALFKLTEAPNSSIIWFSRETYKIFKQLATMECTCASDIQVAGMLIHFVLTGGKHPYGEKMDEILKNLEKSVPQLSTTDIDLHDLITWMLLYDSSERPNINQVLSHVYFWTSDRKWRFILACAGIGPQGGPLPILLSDLQTSIDTIALRDNIKGCWVQVIKKKFPKATSVNDDDTPTGLLRFIRSCIEKQTAVIFNSDSELQNFIVTTFAALPLSLYRILETTTWLQHPVLKPFTTIDSVSA